MTIVIDDVPDDVAEALRRRAEGCGRPLSAFVREHLVELAGLRAAPDKAAVMAEVERVLANDSSPGISRRTVAESRRELRGE